MLGRINPCVILAALAGGVLGAVTGACAQDVEPNNSMAEARAVQLPGTVAGMFTSVSDEDWFLMTLTSPTALRVEAWQGARGQCPSGFDPYMQLYSSDGTMIANVDDDGANLCAMIDTTTIPGLGMLPAGTYFLRMHFYNSAHAPFPIPYGLTISSVGQSAPVQESFTYQGVLKENGAPVTGTKEMVFSVWTDATDTNPAKRLSLPLQYSAMEIVNGQFTAELDFALAGMFDGTDRFLQIEVGEPGGPGRTVLEPRVKITPTPMALSALRSRTAERSVTADAAAQATRASVADHVSWNAITGMPAGFADGNDDVGPWRVEQNTMCTVFRPVGINTATPGFDLAVVGTAAKSGGGSWSTFCDSRLKHDIEPLSGTLDKLLGLRGYSFVYNDDAVQKRLALPGTQIGLIAEEVERVFPDWVQRDPDGYRYVTERATTALMVEALRDLRKEKDASIEQAKGEIDGLRRENEELRARLERIEKALNGSGK